MSNQSEHSSENQEPSQENRDQLDLGSNNNSMGIPPAAQNLQSEVDEQSRLANELNAAAYQDHGQANFSLARDSNIAVTSQHQDQQNPLVRQNSANSNRSSRIVNSSFNAVNRHQNQVVNEEVKEDESNAQQISSQGVFMCNVCKDYFNTSNKVALNFPGCQHTQCRECIIKHSKIHFTSRGGWTESDNRVICSFDKNEHKVKLSELRPNHQIMSSIENAQSTRAIRESLQRANEDRLQRQAENARVKNNQVSSAPSVISRSQGGSQTHSINQLNAQNDDGDSDREDYKMQEIVQVNDDDEQPAAGEILATSSQIAQQWMNDDPQMVQHFLSEYHQLRDGRLLFDIMFTRDIWPSVTIDQYKARLQELLNTPGVQNLRYGIMSAQTLQIYKDLLSQYYTSILDHPSLPDILSRPLSMIEREPISHAISANAIQQQREINRTTKEEEKERTSRQEATEEATHQDFDFPADLSQYRQNDEVIVGGYQYRTPDTRTRTNKSVDPTSLHQNYEIAIYRVKHHGMFGLQMPLHIKWSQLQNFLHIFRQDTQEMILNYHAQFYKHFMRHTRMMQENKRSNAQKRRGANKCADQSSIQSSSSNSVSSNPTPMRQQRRFSPRINRNVVNNAGPLESGNGILRDDISPMQVNFMYRRFFQHQLRLLIPHLSVSLPKEIYDQFKKAYENCRLVQWYEQLRQQNPAVGAKSFNALIIANINSPVQNDDRAYDSYSWIVENYRECLDYQNYMEETSNQDQDMRSRSNSGVRGGQQQQQHNYSFMQQPYSGGYYNQNQAGQPPQIQQVHNQPQMISGQMYPLQNQIAQPQILRLQPPIIHGQLLPSQHSNNQIPQSQQFVAQQPQIQSHYSQHLTDELLDEYTAYRNLCQSKNITQRITSISMFQEWATYRARGGPIKTPVQWGWVQCGNEIRRNDGLPLFTDTDLIYIFQFHTGEGEPPEQWWKQVWGNA